MRREASTRSIVMAVMATFSLAAAAALPYDSDPRWKAARVDGGRVGVMIELADEPTAQSYARALAAPLAVRALGAGVTAEADSAARLELSRVEAAQQSILPALAGAAIGAEVIYRVQRVYNGIAAYVDVARVDAIRRLPGVKAVHPLVPDHLALTSSVPWIGAPQVWQGIGNATGTGVSIGIIDSGVDYLHKDFGGTGVYRPDGIYTSASWPKTAKVVGGYDFAGDAYTGSNTPKPDPDPMDLASDQGGGHGTHVAGIAAGYGVSSDGTTYSGPYSPAVDYSTFTVGPGVAPGAKLYAIRIFGSGGSTGLTSKGIEWALDPNGDGNLSDHLDVINLSLGSSFGDIGDPTAVSVQNAVAAGVVVVVAAGNDGDTTYVVSSPSVASGAISVAATGDAGNRSATLQVTSPAEIAGNLNATAAAFGGATPESGLTAGVVLASPSTACSAITNGADLAGKIALIDRGTCTFVSKVKAAQVAGAAGVIVTDNTAEALIIMAGADATITIPAVFITQADGATLKGKLPTPGVEARLTLLSLAGTVPYFSSRGPRETQDGLKPDIAAPGYSITSASSQTGNGAVNMSGTSMSTPHVAGAMALLKQLHPTWTPAALKALAMNTATDTFLDPNQQGPLMSPMRVGAGELYLPTAASSQAIAYDADHPDLVSVSFGAFEVSGTTTLAHTVKVENRGSSAATFALGYTATSDLSGVDIAFPGGQTVTVPAGGSTTFSVQLSATAAAMGHNPDPGMDTTMDGEPRFWLGEEAGYVTLTPGSGTALRVPLYAAARPVAAMGTLESGIDLGGANGTVTVNLSGRGLDSGASSPADVVSLVTPVELQYTGPATAPLLDREATLRYVGAVSDFATAGSVAAATLEFGLVTVGDWATPNDVTFSVAIDTNRDGTNDYTLQTVDSATFFDPTATASDAFGIELCPTGKSCTWVGPANRFSPDQLDTVAFGTNVVVVWVPASSLGLTDGNSTFNYKVIASTPSSDAVSYTPSVGYDVARPGLAPLAGSFGPVPSAGGGILQLAYDRANYAANASQGLLLLHHHNASGQRAQVLPVSTTTCSLSCSATVPDQAFAGTAATFAATAATSGCSETIVYDWDFGDGTAHGSGATAEHTYANAGAFSWRLLTSAAGITCTQSGSVTVDPAVTPLPVHRRPLHAEHPGAI
jgi:subtilisin family serine protease